MRLMTHREAYLSAAENEERVLDPMQQDTAACYWCEEDATLELREVQGPNGLGRLGRVGAAGSEVDQTLLEAR